jgi:hypothetical protein
MSTYVEIVVNGKLVKIIEQPKGSDKPFKWVEETKKQEEKK